jgi:hypothetical protein
MATVKALVAGDKDLPPMDERNPTCNRLFAKVGIPQTEEARRVYSIQAPIALCAGVFRLPALFSNGPGAWAWAIPTNEDLMIAPRFDRAES